MKTLTTMSMEQLLARVEELKKNSGVDLSTAEDLAIAVMNLISLEEHFFFTGVKTKKDEYFDTAGEIREMRENLLAKLMPNHEGETWCAGKHLLAGAMRLIEVGTKLQAEGQKEEARAMFARAYKLYCLFMALKLKLVTALPAEALAEAGVAAPMGAAAVGNVGDLLGKLADCCDE